MFVERCIGDVILEEMNELVQVQRAVDLHQSLVLGHLLHLFELVNELFHYLKLLQNLQQSVLQHFRLLLDDDIDNPLVL